MKLSHHDVFVCISLLFLSLCSFYSHKKAVVEFRRLSIGICRTGSDSHEILDPDVSVEKKPKGIGSPNWTPNRNRSLCRNAQIRNLMNLLCCCSVLFVCLSMIIISINTIDFKLMSGSDFPFILIRQPTPFFDSLIQKHRSKYDWTLKMCSCREKKLTSKMAKLCKQNFLSIKWKFGVPLIWQTDFNEPIPIRDSWFCRITCKKHNNTQTPRTSSGFVCNQLFSKRLIPISSRDKIQLDAMKSNLIAFSIFIRQNIFDSSGSVEQIQNGNSFQSKIYMYIQWILCIQWCCYCCWWWWCWFHRLASCSTDSIILLNDLFVLLFFFAH